MKGDFLPCGWPTPALTGEEKLDKMSEKLDKMTRRYLAANKKCKDLTRQVEKLRGAIVCIKRYGYSHKAWYDPTGAY